MKPTTALFVLLFTLFLPLWSSAQPGNTILYEDNFGMLTLEYADTLNGKNVYSATEGNTTVSVAWSGTQWEIFINVGSGPVVSFVSVQPTESNPPNFTVGDWQDVAADGTELLGLSGSGTSDVVLSAEAIGWKEDRAIRLYPNPARQQGATLSFRSTRAYVGSVTVHDSMGKALADYPVNVQAGENQLLIGSSTWKAGTYVIGLELADGQPLRQSLIVQ